MTNRARARGADRRRSIAGRPTARTRSTRTSAPGGTTRRSCRSASAAGSTTLETMRRASQWLQYEGLRYAVEATMRRGAGVDPLAAQRAVPERLVHDRRRLARRSEAGVLGRARARTAGAPSASFATWAWGGERARCARDVTAPARLVDLDGARRRRVGRRRDRRPARGLRGRRLRPRRRGAQPLRDDAHGESRAAARPAAGARSSSAYDELVVRNAGAVAALGIVLEDARPVAPGWVTFSDNVLDLLPGEARELEVEGRSASCAWRAGMLAASALAPDGSPVDGFRFDGALTVTYEGAEPVDAGIRVELRAAARPDDPRWLVPGVFYGENRPEGYTRLYPRFTPGRRRRRADGVATPGRFAPTAARRPAVFARGGGLVTSERSPLGPGRRRLRAARRPAGDLARLSLPRGAAPLQRLGDARAARRADVPLAAGRARRARVRASTTATRARAPRPRPTTFEDPRLGLRRGGRRARRAWGSERWHYRARSAAADRDGRVRPRRHRRAGRPGRTCTSRG